MMPDEKYRQMTAYQRHLKVLVGICTRRPPEDEAFKELSALILATPNSERHALELAFAAVLARAVSATGEA